MKMKFMIVGFGWRAQFYVRAAQALPDQLGISAVVMHSEERAKQVQAETGLFATSDLEAALATEPAFALLCVPRSVMTEWIVRLMERKLPVLCETPPGRDVDELNRLWEIKLRLDGKVQVAEQYFLQPYYRAVQRIIDDQVLGCVSNVSMSAIHGYHAISIFRKFLGIDCEGFTMRGTRYHFPVTKTRGRGGWDQSGQQKIGCRDRVEIVFDSGKAAFFDFDDEQYFSPIRSRTWNIQGDRGEIRDTQVCYLDAENRPVTEQMYRMDDGVYNIDGWSHLYISFQGRRVYENPFPGVRLNDDEIAVADVLMHMKTYVETGADFYPLREGLKDAYLSFRMEDALTTGKELYTPGSCWSFDPTF